MNKLNKNGVALVYQDRGAGSRAIVFIHGLGFDQTTFGPQIEFFSRTHRVIAKDLRGHGASDAPKQEYAMPVLAEDTAWLCAQLGLVKPVFVGHSMGGNVALTLAALHSEVPASILLIDSLLFPRLDMAATLKQVGEALKGPNFEEVRAQVEPLFYLPTDNDAICARALMDCMVWCGLRPACCPLAPRRYPLDVSGCQCFNQYLDTYIVRTFCCSIDCWLAWLFGVDIWA
jgi:pimeloyl-ACP methyl ester carboxylesterase